LRHGFIGYPLVARYNRLHRERIQHREDLRCQAVTDIQNLTERLYGQDARQSQWQVTQNGSDKIFEFFVRRPAREQESVKPPRQLHVAVDRLASFRDSKAYKRHFEFVAQESERVQYDSLFAVGA
jgi:hypothetical protein